MKLHVSHKTTYSYDHPVHYALQQLRLIPRTGHGQTVLDWSSTIIGGTKQVTFDDQFSNHTELVLLDEDTTKIEIESAGVVETENRNGVIGRHTGFAPLWLFELPTSQTTPGPLIRKLARGYSGVAPDDFIVSLHDLSAEIRDTVTYKTGHTNSDTLAETALSDGHGVCQDHAHIMIAAARVLGHPARYVSGYLMMNETIEQDASHAWCEIWTKTLGWIGFDVSNVISPDERYVRVAIGRDYADAAPIHGIRQGQGVEGLHVSLQVQQ